MTPKIPIAVGTFAAAPYTKQEIRQSKANGQRRLSYQALEPPKEVERNLVRQERVRYQRYGDESATPDEYIPFAIYCEI